MHHALILLSRTAAGLIATLSFYFSSFMYEDEEGVLQNRVENLWVAVYDRARITNSTTTALFNTIAQALRTFFSAVFGEHLLSMQALCVSGSLSIGAGLLSADVLYWVRNSAWVDTISITRTVDSALAFILSHQVTVFLYRIDYLYFASEHPLIAETIFSLICFGLAFLPTYSKNKWALRLCSLPLVLCLLRSIALGWTGFFFFRGRLFYLIIPIILLSSILWDFAAIFVIRKLLVSVSEVITVARLFILVCEFVLFTVGVIVFPFALVLVLDTLFRHSQRIMGFGFGAAEILAVMNVTTVLYCFIPIGALIITLIHRFFWPVLSRVIYMVAREKLLTSPKVLVPIGILSLTFALNLDHVGIKDLLKLIPQ
jgi:hypothetical protein